MAKCSSCLFGVLTGSIGKLTFYSYKGRQMVRMKGKSKREGIKELLKKEKLSQSEINQINSCFILSSLSHLTRNKGLMYRIWYPFLKKKRRFLFAQHLFSSYNFHLLFNSLNNKLYGSQNIPDLTKIIVCPGNYLESAKLRSGIYNKETGELKVGWDPKVYKDGKSDDSVYIMAISWEIKNQEFSEYKNIKLWGSPKFPVGQRKAGAGSIKLTPGLKGKIAAYLFLSSQSKWLGYSESTSILVARGTSLRP